MISQRSIVAASLSATHHPDVYSERRSLVPGVEPAAGDSRRVPARVMPVVSHEPGCGGRGDGPTRCEHGIPNDRTCPECVLASWESAPRGTEPRRLREEIRRDERLERLAEDRAERREWELGDEPVPRVIPGSRRVA